MDIEQIQSLVDNEVVENRGLEYKQELSLENRDQKKEFLLDVTAFANSFGGRILIGIIDDNGLPQSICGVEASKVDGLKLAAETLLAQCVTPRLVGIEFESVPCGDGRCVLVISIPSASFGPHMVKYGAMRCFYKRHSSGKIEMDIDDLRLEFLKSGTLIERARDWIGERIDEYASAPRGLVRDNFGVLLFHMCPVVAGPSQGPVSVKDILGSAGHWATMSTPLGGPGGYSIEVDGLALMKENDRQYPRATTTYFRSGYVEGALSKAAIFRPDGPPISAYNLESLVKNFFENVWSNLSRLGYQFPIVLGGGFVRCPNLNIFVSDLITRDHPDDPRQLSGSRVVLPDVVIEQGNEVTWSNLRPYFDSIWNAFGLSRSYHFDAVGQRKDEQSLRRAYGIR